MEFKMWTFYEFLFKLKLCFDKIIDYCQSREGRKQIRRIVTPIALMGSLVMCITGAIWYKYSHPQCGVDYTSAKFSIKTNPSTGERIISGNGCPGYNWKSTSSRYPAGEFGFSYAVASAPKISTSKIYVGNSNPILGPIGVALNGVPIYSPSNTNHQSNSDECGGSILPETQFAFNEPLAGYYNYRTMPGLIASNTQKQQYTYCNHASLWYNTTKSKSHSPLIGFMADGIPIYGPQSDNGTQPTDLDECGGHATDKYKFYHYHFRITYPYSVECLRGCADGSMNPAINSDNCNIDNTQSYDYSSIQYISFSYGGEGVNSTNWTGPTTLLTFGFVIFIPASLCCLCIICSKKKRSVDQLAYMGINNNTPVRNPLQGNNANNNHNSTFGYTDDENIL